MRGPATSVGAARAATIAKGASMRILFVAAAGAHVPWIVPVCWAAKLAGHEIRVAVRPEGVPALTSAGLPVLPVGAKKAVASAQAKHAGLAFQGPRHLPAGWMSRTDLMDKQVRVTMANRFIAGAEAMAPDTVAFARAWRPDLVVYDTVALAGLVAASAVGVPAVGNMWGYSFNFAFGQEEELGKPYRALFDRFGAEPIDPALWIDPCPPSLRLPYPVPRLPMRLTAYCGPTVLPPWLTEVPAGPRVCVSGGMTTSALVGLLPQIVDAVHRLDGEVVVTATEAQRPLLPPLPPQARVIDPFPLDVLLPTCQAVIQHGGIGTGMMALLSGIPQVVMAQTAATEFWGERVESAGIGINIDNPETVGAAEIEAALDAVLHKPTYRDRAVVLRDEIAAMPSAGGVLDVLARYAAGESPDPALLIAD
jgi:UDP:flavonoid glycosyltransferase YjiC (YdhE family)